jgi:phosphopantetheinyl transferase (holo-ACP synthase)
VVKIETINSDLRLGLLDLDAFSGPGNIEQKREVEARGIACLLKELFPDQPVDLQYTPEKKPHLKNCDCHISISHSHNMLAILVSRTHSTGVDVELIREKVINIKHKFLNEQELKFAGSNVEKLTTLWAAKEAIFKAYGKKGVEFSTNISIDPFSEEEIYFSGRMDLPNFKKSWQLCRRKILNYILVFILSEI